SGGDQTITRPNSAQLSGSAADDGLPNKTLTVLWTVVSGPGSVTFANPQSTSTTAAFSVAGTYVLSLTASDGSLSSSAQCTITVLDSALAGFKQIAVDQGPRPVSYSLPATVQYASPSGSGSSCTNINTP